MLFNGQPAKIRGDFNPVFDSESLPPRHQDTSFVFIGINLFVTLCLRG